MRRGVLKPPAPSVFRLHNKDTTQKKNNRTGHCQTYFKTVGGGTVILLEYGGTNINSTKRFPT